MGVSVERKRDQFPFIGTLSVSKLSVTNGDHSSVKCLENPVVKGLPSQWTETRFPLGLYTSPHSFLFSVSLPFDLRTFVFKYRIRIR